MWESLAEPWRICIEEAWDAYCHGSLPIGAAITDDRGRVVARGRNRIQEGEADGRFLHGHRLAHAEVNALIALDAAVDPRGCVLYTTTEPCTYCAGAVRMMRLEEVRYASRDGSAGAASLFEATPWMRRGDVHVFGPMDSRLEVTLVAMLVEWALGYGSQGVPGWCARMGEVVPAGLPLAEELHRSGELRAGRDAGRSAAWVIEVLYVRVA